MKTSVRSSAVRATSFCASFILATSLLATSLFATSLLVGACSRPDDDPLDKTPVNDNYVGTVSVLYEGEYFDNENITVTVSSEGDASSEGETAAEGDASSEGEDGTLDDGREGTLTILIHRIKFVPKMPVTVDVKINGVSYTQLGGAISFSGDDIVPLSGILPMKRYLVTDLAGTIIDGECVFSLKFGEYPTSFSGKAQ